MKPFDPDARCPKCGHDDIGAEFTVFRRYSYDPPEEKMERTCTRCGFVWEEAPLDAAKEDE